MYLLRLILHAFYIAHCMFSGLLNKHSIFFQKAVSMISFLFFIFNDLILKLKLFA